MHPQLTNGKPEEILPVPDNVMEENSYTVELSGNVIEIDNKTGELLSVFSEDGKFVKIKWHNRTIDNTRKSKFSSIIEKFISNLI